MTGADCAARTTTQSCDHSTMGAAHTRVTVASRACALARVSVATITALRVVGDVQRLFGFFQLLKKDILTDYLAHMVTALMTPRLDRRNFRHIDFWHAYAWMCLAASTTLARKRHTSFTTCALLSLAHRAAYARMR